MWPVRKWINPSKQLLEFDQKYHSGGSHVTSGCSHHNKDRGKEDQVKHIRCTLDDQFRLTLKFIIYFQVLPGNGQILDEVCSLYGGLHIHTRKSMKIENEKDKRNGDCWARRQNTGDLVTLQCAWILVKWKSNKYLHQCKAWLFSLLQMTTQKSSYLTGWGTKCVSERQDGRVCVWLCVCVHVTCQMSFSTSSFNEQSCLHFHSTSAPYGCKARTFFIDARDLNSSTSQTGQSP